MTRAQAMTIACNSLPQGARVRLTFEGSRARYSGIYTVRDTGAMGPGVIDLYLGDFGEEVGQETSDFGRVTIKAEIL
jgi:3D (Asp-Asp-Asp) domain-containing protein